MKFKTEAPKPQVLILGGNPNGTMGWNDAHEISYRTPETSSPYSRRPWAGMMPMKFNTETPKPQVLILGGNPNGRPIGQPNGRPLGAPSPLGSPSTAPRQPPAAVNSSGDDQQRHRRQPDTRRVWAISVSCSACASALPRLALAPAFLAGSTSGLPTAFTKTAVALAFTARLRCLEVARTQCTSAES